MYILLIEAELERAKTIHPNYPENMFERVAIISEEMGEVVKATLDHSYGKDSIEHIKEELIQTAAMCIRMLEKL